MQINELKTLKSSIIGRFVRHIITSSDPNYAHRSLTMHLGNLGANELGSGVAGTVISHPNADKNKPVYKLYTKDRGYDNFISYARKNQDNPHIPKIHAVAKVAIDKDNTRHLKVVKMERLQPLDPDHPVRKYLGMGIIGTGEKHLNDTLTDNSYKGINLRKNFPSFHKTLVDLASQGGNLDLHMGNIMQRSDGTPVITDPFYEGSEDSNNDKLNISTAPRPKKDELEKLMPKPKNKTPSISDTELLRQLKEEAPVNNVGSGNIAGLGVGPKGEPGRSATMMPMVRRSRDFAGKAVFTVHPNLYNEAKLEKKKYQRWSKYLEEAQDELSPLREYANANPGSPIIIENEKTGAMCYVRYGSRNGKNRK